MATDGPRAAEAPRLRALMGLRGVGALGVLGMHVYWGGWREDAAFSLGCLWLETFFVLSGFVMALNYVPRIRRGDFSLWRYGVRRLLRVYPVHWLVLPLLFLRDYMPFQYLPALWRNVALVQCWWPDFRVVSSGYHTAWFLSVLVAFYAAFPALGWLMARGSRWLKGAVCMAAIGAYVSALALVPAGEPIRVYFEYWVPTMLVDFCVGMAAWWVYERVRTARVSGAALRGLNAGAWTLAFAAAALALCLVRNGCRPLLSLFWVPVGAVVVMTAWTEKTLPHRLLTWGPVAWLGRVSFSLYVIQYFTIHVVARYVYAWHLQVHPDVQALVMAAASVGAAAVLHYCAEAPLMRLARMVTQSGRRRPQA